MVYSSYKPHIRQEARIKMSINLNLPVCMPFCIEEMLLLPRNKIEQTGDKLALQQRKDEALISTLNPKSKKQWLK